MIYPMSLDELSLQEAWVEGRAGAILAAFAARIEVSPRLFAPDVCSLRVGSSGVINAALPQGWMMVCDEWTDELVRRRPRYNRARLRKLCVALKVPYWDTMNVDEMKAVIVRWAIYEQVPEWRFEV
jgi:hypothetical protein